MGKISRLKQLEEKILRKKMQKQREEDHAMHMEKIKKYCEHPGHKKPVTRRDFLEVGVLGMSAMMLGPSIHSILSRLSPEAYAQAVGECPSVAAAGGPVPFINLHLAGGFQTLSAVTPRTTAGARLGSYTRLGLGATPNFVNDVFANGAELFDNANGQANVNQGFYRGLLNGAQASTLANAALVSVPIRDNGDSDAIQVSILGLVDRSGRAGSKLGFLRRNGDADTGINDRAAFNIVTSIQPQNINNTAAIVNSVQFSGALARLTNPQQVRLARAIQSLNAEQASRITGLNGGKEMANLIKCATDKNISNLEGGGPQLDPRNVPGMNAIWNNYANTNSTEANGAFNNDSIAAIVNNVLNGNAAGAAINIGGYDIHNNNNRVNQENGAFSIGQCVGRILESARLINSKVFIHISTNGANVNAGGTPADGFNNDDGGDFGCAHFIAYDPAAPVQTTSDLPQQIGGLTAQGNVDRNVFTSNPSDTGAAIFYNYCLFSGGGEALFNQVMTGIKTYSAAEKAIMRKIA